MRVQKAHITLGLITGALVAVAALSGCGNTTHSAQTTQSTVSAPTADSNIDIVLTYIGNPSRAVAKGTYDAVMPAGHEYVLVNLHVTGEGGGTGSGWGYFAGADIELKSSDDITMGYLNLGSEWENTGIIKLPTGTYRVICNGKDTGAQIVVVPGTAASPSAQRSSQQAG